MALTLFCLFSISGLVSNGWNASSNTFADWSTLNPHMWENKEEQRNKIYSKYIYKSFYFQVNKAQEQRKRKSTTRKLKEYSHDIGWVQI